MFLPDQVNELYDRFSDKVYETNNLDQKTKELISVACSVAVDCAPCLEWHYQRAIKAGATRDEISEVLAISMAISSGSKRAKYGPVISKMEQEK
jgi:AhpD family alkylhydroperoxidase